MKAKAFEKKNIFTRFGTPRAMITTVVSYFYNQVFGALLDKLK